MEQAPRRITGLRDIAGNYDCLFCDVWGVLHNGLEAYDDTVRALTAFRREWDGTVVLVTNAPRPARDVAERLYAMDIPDDAFDHLVTSGDVTRAAVGENRGANVYHLGPERDLGYYEGLDVTLTGAETADLISCTGLFDDTSESPEDYRTRLEQFVARRLPMVCANPDIVVERGESLVWCAGALARLYKDLGGEVTLAGKPYGPIYEAALDLAGITDRARVLAIGDGLPTDIRGADNAGIDVLFITDGIHAADFGPPDAPDPARIVARLREEKLRALAWMPRLRWEGGQA